MRNLARFRIGIGGALLLGLLAVESAYGADRAAGDFPCRRQAIKNDLATFSECSPDFPAAAKSATVTPREALPFLERYSRQLGFGRPREELSLTEQKRGLGGLHTRYQQVYQGHPIAGADVFVHQNADGAISRIHSRYKKPVGILGNAQPGITGDEAGEIAKHSLALHTHTAIEVVGPISKKLVWLPDHAGRLRLCWEILLSTRNPAGSFRLRIDAGDGALLQEEELSAYWNEGNGYSYWPNPVQTSKNISLHDDDDQTPVDLADPLNSQRYAKPIENLALDTSTLNGRYVDLVSIPSQFNPLEPIADEPGLDYFYDRSDARFEQFMVYHAVDSVQRYVQQLGFSQTTHNGIHDAVPVKADAHWDSTDTSRYDPLLDALLFGNGGVDDAEDADIIVHEYGHALQHAQNSCWPGGAQDLEMRAMGEGFSDYLAASYFLQFSPIPDDIDGAACIGEWDSTAYSTTGCLRRVDEEKHYADFNRDPSAKPHSNGKIWSHALWDIRLALGATTADRVILEHHFAVPCNASMPDAARLVIETDKSLHGGANENTLKLAFCRRGILSGTSCDDTDGDGIVDSVDNCRLVKNSSQLDTDNDGYGNRCDADFDQNGFVTAPDLSRMKKYYGSPTPLYDLNGDGFVTAADVSIMKSLYGKPPGPGRLPDSE